MAEDPTRALPLNDTLNLTCIYDGFPAATAQWFYNNNAISEADPRITLTDTQNALTLTVTNIGYNDTGEYICRATNSIGSNVGTAIMLLIAGEYRFQEQ